MYFTLLLTLLLPLVACQHDLDYYRRDDNFNDIGYKDYRDPGYDDRRVTPDRGYDLDGTDGPNYRRPHRDQTYTYPQDSQLTTEPSNIQPHWFNALMDKLASSALSQSPTEQTINLKVSGKVELVKSFKGMEGWQGHDHPHHGPWTHGGHWWMKKHMHGPMGKMMWFNHAMEFHKHLHDLEKHQDEEDPDEDDEDEDDEEDDEEEDPDHKDIAAWTRFHSRLTCPFWITQQFVKLCKCPTVNSKMESVLGHPLKPFPQDPMNVFNNTRGMKEVATGDMEGLMIEVQTMDPADLKKLFFGGMIKSMCEQAKRFVHEVDVFEETVRARARAGAAHPGRIQTYPSATSGASSREMGPV